MTVSAIIELLGGSKAVADYTGWPYTTVDTWREVNQVPDWRKGKLLEMAVDRQKALSATDFPASDERLPRKAAA
jgi:hypothetical protein